MRRCLLLARKTVIQGKPELLLNPLLLGCIMTTRALVCRHRLTVSLTRQEDVHHLYSEGKTSITRADCSGKSVIFMDIGGNLGSKFKCTRLSAKTIKQHR